MSEHVEHSLQAWATSLGMERRTLEARLTKTGYEWKARDKLTARTIYNALMGDKDAETIRNLKADADRKEREEREANRELVRFEEVERLLTEFVLTPLSTRLNDLRLTKPEMANWVDETMKIVREGLPKQ